MTPPGFAEVIGDPVDHSLSPVIHGFWLDQLGIEATYGRRRVSRADLPDYLQERRADENWRGSNVTMPLKLDAIELADEVSDRAVATGAANVLLMRDGKLHAANTDVGAILILLKKLSDQGRAIRNVTLLGNGGAARAALVALKLTGIAAVRIQARDMSAAMKLAVEFGVEEEPAPLTARIESDGLINATPLGMTGGQCFNCELSHMPDNGWVFEMVTEPADTALLQAARLRKLAVATGLDMLIEQAATSFALFFGQDPPRDRDAILWQKLRS